VFGYAVVRIKDVILSLNTGLNPRSNFKLNVENANCDYVTGKEINNNIINLSSKTDKITKEAVELINRRSKLSDDTLLFASTGCSTVGRMAVVKKYDGTWNVSETMYCIKTNDMVTTRYLMYYLYSKSAKECYEPLISKGTVPHLKVSDLLEMPIPIPSTITQNRIVSLLEKFDSYSNDLSVGLPAEIEARQKQYEYYRDKLLNFERMAK